ncbi:MAG: hypothetical protein GX605_07315 [Chloroflexi bacterium]|nr:hypothetical protein [Chloroflexota bacterium]
MRALTTLFARGDRRVFALALACILILGGALRLSNLNWDAYQHAHPDERHITMVASSLRLPSDLKLLLDPFRSTVNPFRAPPQGSQSVGEPRAFTYGHFPLYLMTAVANGMEHFLQPSTGVRWADYDHIHLVGRVLSGLFDLLTVVFIFLLGRRLYGPGVGLLAAALLAATVTHIQLSHYAAFDVVQATWVAATVYFSVRLAENGRARDLALAGLSAGLAIGSLVRAAPVLAAVAVAVLVRLLQAATARRADMARWVLGGLGALLLALLVFATTNPFSILDSAQFLRNMEEQSAMVSGEADFPFTRQYRGTTPFLYQIEQQVRWGMGWPLGLFAFAGLAWVIGRAVRGRATRGEWVLLAGVVPYFIINGLFMVKFMRYMIVITPLLVLMGAYLLAETTRALRRWLPRVRLPQAAAWALPTLVLLATWLYAVAFAGIYAREHTWVSSSRWIYANVPDGSVLAVEHWDDELPKTIDEPGMNPGAHRYQHLRLPLYEDDNQGKYEIIKQTLQEADYIFLSSNRLYGSIPRLPQRYPMTIRYYDLLFSEQLGFERVATFTSRPQLLGVEIVDDGADESFTVYDHPKPILFRKVRTLSDQEIWALLGGTWEGAIPGWTGQRSTRQPSQDEVAKTLLLDRPVNELPVVNDFRWNSLANRSTAVAVACWWLALAVLGLAALPLTYTVFGRLRGRGYLFARSLGLLVVGYINWLLASLGLLGNRLTTLWLGIAVLAALSAWLTWRQQAAFAAWLREHRRFILFSEALFAAAFLLFVGIRILNPDLWQPWNGGEKSMEFAFLNAIVRSPSFPPYDPYYAHGYMNYYYYGQYLMAVLIKLTGITPSVGFNLAVATLFALTVANAFTVVYNLAAKRSAPWREGLTAALLGPFFVALLANLATPLWYLRRLGELSNSSFTSGLPGLQTAVRGAGGLLQVLQGQASLPAFNYWDPSRVIPFTINEFPYWSFLFADLHPHMIGLAFTLLFVGLCLNLYRAGPQPAAPEIGVPRIWAALPSAGRVAGWLLLPLALGALAAINTWDMPTYLGLATAAFLLRAYQGSGRVRWAAAIAFAVGLAGASYLLYLPFFAHYQAIAVGIGLVRGQGSLGDWLTVWGFFFFVALSWGLAALSRNRARMPLLRWARLVGQRWERLPRLTELHGLLVRQASLGYTLALAGVGLFVLLWVALIALGHQILAAALLPLGAAFLLLLARPADSRQSFATLLLFTGLLVAAGVEVVYMRDFLGGGDHYRMNTLFKFYMQVWVLLGCGAAAVLPTLWAWIGKGHSRGLRWAWQGALALLLAGAFLFIPIGTVARVADRFPGERPALGTLDGMAYMTVGRYTWPDQNNPIDLQWDYQALQWLLENVQGTPVVAEGRIDYYREGGMRVASYTGLPTFLGAHQSEQRYDWQVGERDGLARDFFNTADVQRAQEIIADLHVAYIYIGTLERTVYDERGIAKFEQMAQDGLLEVAYQNEAVTIYRAP